MHIDVKQKEKKKRRKSYLGLISRITDVPFKASEYTPTNRLPLQLIVIPNATYVLVGVKLITTR